MITLEGILFVAMGLGLLCQVVVFILQPKVNRRNEERMTNRLRSAVRDEWDRCVGSKKK